MKKFLINFGLLNFLVFSVLVFVLYFGLLYEKLVRPSFKNLGTEGFIWLAVLIVPMMIADVFILRRFINKINRK